MAGNIDSSSSNSQELVVGVGVSIQGSIKAPARVHLLGTIEGDLEAQSVVIGESGTIEGSLKARSADIYGTVSKDVEITDTLMLRSTTHLNGDVRYRNVQIELGARLTCTMDILSESGSGRSASSASVGGSTSSSTSSGSSSSSSSSGSTSSGGSGSAGGSSASGSSSSSSSDSTGNDSGKQDDRNSSSSGSGSSDQDKSSKSGGSGSGDAGNSKG